jgi:dihydrofolate reductase
VRTSLIAAVAENDVIGRDGGLPWYLPDDLRRFRALTTGHVVVVGRRTHESIVDRLGHPLPGRISVVVTRNSQPGDGPVLRQPSVPGALSVARAIEEFAGRAEVFVIGGAGIYAAALSEVDCIYLTRVHAEVSGDVRMPARWLAGFTLAETAELAVHSELPYSHQRYERR